jgi:putative alpha-1,2-mannosidase
MVVRTYVHLFNSVNFLRKFDVTLHGLTNLLNSDMIGNEKFIAKLDKFFDEAWYNHGNEPDHHTLYLYAYVPGHAWRVQDRLPEIIRTQYGPTERSMSGNDDAGQMSAWLVMSSMGLYQVCPGCGGRSEYVLGLPLFASMEVSLPSSGSQICNQSVLDNDQTCTFHQDKKTLLVETIRMNNLSTEKYIQMVTWNGCEYNCAFIPHAMIAEGGHLKVYLGAEPNKQWGGEGRKCMDSYFYPGDTALGYRHEGKTATC